MDPDSADQQRIKVTLAPRTKRRGARAGWVARARRWRCPWARRKVGAIPYRVTEGGVEFLLVTSRRTGRWIFPKGGLIAGLDGPQSAAREAYEEGGVHGAIAPRPVGRYLDRVRGGRTVEIRLYPLNVERQLEDWPEKNQRRRRWASLEEVRRLHVSRSLIELAEKTRRDLESQAWR